MVIVAVVKVALVPAVKRIAMHAGFIRQTLISSWNVRSAIVVHVNFGLSGHLHKLTPKVVSRNFTLHSASRSQESTLPRQILIYSRWYFKLTRKEGNIS